jgi:hypothetical protein
MIFPVAGLAAESSAGAFILSEGTYRSAGVPGFGPNRISALFGRYDDSLGDSVSVWAVDEQLLFNPAIWEKSELGKYGTVYARMDADSRIVVVSRTITMQDEMKDKGRWFFVFMFDGKKSMEGCVAFVGGFVDRTERFFSATRRFADLSFPATLSAAGKP